MTQLITSGPHFLRDGRETLSVFGPPLGGTLPAMQLQGLPDFGQVPHPVLIRFEW